MKISTEIMSATRLVGEEKAVELCAKAGFDAWDFTIVNNMCRCDWGTQRAYALDHPLSGSDYLAFARKLKQIGLDNGIHCNQSHAPDPVFYPEMRDYLMRAIECTAEAGGNICVIHPDSRKTVEENAEMYLELLPFAKACNVKIAVENMYNWDNKSDHAAPAACSDPDSFNAQLDAVNDGDFVACLDIGHAEMRGVGTSAPKMIRALGNRLQALHIHDNDKCHDSHQIPFSMSIDFAAIAQALKDIRYTGYLTLEATAFLGDLTADDALTGLSQLVQSATKLRMMMN